MLVRVWRKYFLNYNILAIRPFNKMLCYVQVLIKFGPSPFVSFSFVSKILIGLTVELWSHFEFDGVHRSNLLTVSLVGFINAVCRFNPPKGLVCLDHLFGMLLWLDLFYQLRSFWRNYTLPPFGLIKKYIILCSLKLIRWSPVIWTFNT